MNRTMTVPRAIGLLTAALVALGVLWATTPIALADDYPCTGSVGAETKDNIRVPDGTNCSLTDTTVEGTIYVGTGSRLQASGVQVDGNVQAEGAAVVAVTGNATVGGSIQITQGGAAMVADVKVTGDILFEGNNKAITISSNEVGGDLQVFKNTGGVLINRNVITGTLQCTENNPAPTGSGNRAASLENQCAGLGGGGGGGGGDDDIQRHGRIDTFPADPYIGTWVIEGVSYTATAGTEFEQDYGAFAQGVCVEVEATDTTPPVATAIETEEDYQCSGRTDDDDDDAEGELYGKVTQFPAAPYIGTWVIGGLRTFTATNQTEFDRNGREFAVGVTVKIEFTTNLTGVHTAREIEIVYGSDDDDDDDDYGEASGAEGQAYGRLNTKGEVPGIWTIGGIDYLVNAETELDDDDDLTVNTWVKVEYTVLSGGMRVAHEIEETDDDGEVSADDHAKLVGFVEQMPAAGFVGNWVVARQRFVAGPEAEFEQEHGAFAVGSYVEVEYFLDGDTRRIHEIETEAPPGAGDDDARGRIQAIGTPGQVAVAAPAASTWRIDAVAYSVTPATQLIDGSGELVVGATAQVNSYQALNGSHVATRIQAVGEVGADGGRVFLPALPRQ